MSIRVSLSNSVATRTAMTSGFATRARFGWTRSCQSQTNCLPSTRNLKSAAPSVVPGNASAMCRTSSWVAMAASYRLPTSRRLAPGDGRQAHHRDHPAGLPGVVGELRKGVDVPTPKPLAIRFVGDRSLGLERAALGLDRHLRVRPDVHQPRWILRGTAGGAGD